MKRYLCIYSDKEIPKQIARNVERMPENRILRLCEFKPKNIDREGYESKRRMNLYSSIFLRETDDAEDCRACGHQQCLGTGPSSAMLYLPSRSSHKTHMLLCVTWPSTRTTLSNSLLCSVIITCLS
jgi:hypothetical protein